MSLRFEFTPIFWQGLLLLLPILLIRFGLPATIDRRALHRLSYFPPLVGAEKAAFWVYQITNLFLLVYPLFLTIKTDTWLFAAGLAVYLVGVAGYATATASFARQQSQGLICQGIYRFSRNPMYVFFLCWLAGIALLAGSWPYLAAAAIFQLSSHWIIKSEERWCLAQYGREYRDYQRRVPRYWIGAPLVRPIQSRFSAAPRYSRKIR